MKKYLFAVLLTALVSGCSTNDMPEQRPEDLTIVYKEDGGMADMGKTIFLSKDSNYVIFRNNGTENKVYLKYNKADIDNIYKILRDKRFSNIGTHTEDEVYDRGGSSITVSFGGESITKSNTGTTYVDESSKKTYGEISTAINKMVDDFLELLKRNFKIELDTTLIGEGRDLEFNFNTDYTYNSGKEGRRDSILLTVLDGTNMFFLILNEKNPANGRVERKATKQIPITIDPLMIGARFYYAGDEIKWDPINMQIN